MRDRSSGGYLNVNQVDYVSNGDGTYRPVRSEKIYRRTKKRLLKADIVKSDGIRPTNYGCGGDESWGKGSNLYWTTTTPYSYRLSRETYQSGPNWPVGYNFGGFGCSSYGWIIDGNNQFVKRARAIATNKFLTKVGAADLAPAVSLLEARETAQFLQSRGAKLITSLRYLSIGKAVKAITSINRHKVSRVNRRIANHVTSGRAQDKASAALLEYRYAVTPLVGDIQSAARVLNEGFTQWYTCRGFEKVKHTTEYVSSSTTSLTAEYMCKVQGSFTVNDVSKHLMQKAGLSLTASNAANIFWEKIPFSFLVDMAVNVSEYLGLLSATHGLSANWVETTLFCRGDWDYKYERFKATSSYKSEVSDHWYGRKFAMERTVSGSFPLPQIVVDNPFDLYNVATMGALANQLRIGGRHTLDNLRI